MYEEIRLTKRKLDDAFHVLDTAVNPDTPLNPPTKRSNTIKSLYSTLAKYGIKTKEPRRSMSESQTASINKNTPHLSAILSRAASRTKTSFFSSDSPSPAPFLPPTAEYRPSSLPSFLSRLATFKLSTYANKPTLIDAVAASKCGWLNDGQDRLVCGLCKASWVVAGRERLNRDAASALVVKQRASLIDAHKSGCPWKTRQCDDSIYCIPLQSAASMIKEIKSRAAVMDPFVKNIFIKHPMTTTQVTAFTSTVASHTAKELDATDNTDTDSSLAYSEIALVTALFGWSLLPPSAPQGLHRVSTTRPSSIAPTTPSPSRGTSVAPIDGLHGNASQSGAFTFRFPNSITVKPEHALLQCTLCQRRIGLWSFITQSVVPPPPTADGHSSPSHENISTEHVVDPNTHAPSRRSIRGLPPRAFDLLKEHRSYCPYAIRSSVVPSLPIPTRSVAPHRPPGKPSSSSSSLIFKNGSNSSRFSWPQSQESDGVVVAHGALEGWRAVLTLVLRYRMADKQRIEYSFMPQKESNNGQGEGTGDEEVYMDVDNVKAMVNCVKTRGGKDLLNYVKGLLGSS